jgi:hypothetical protein
LATQITAQKRSGLVSQWMDNGMAVAISSFSILARYVSRKRIIRSEQARSFRHATYFPFVRTPPAIE